MTARHPEDGAPRDERAAGQHRRTRRGSEPVVEDRIGNRLPVWGSSADDPTGPIDLPQPPTEYELAYSGGWGAPGHVDATGPIPRLGRSAHPEPPAQGTCDAARAQNDPPSGRDTAPRDGDDTGGGTRSGDGSPGPREERGEDTVHGLPADTATTWHSRTPTDADSDPFTRRAAAPSRAHGSRSGATAGEPSAAGAAGSAPRPPGTTSDHFVYSKPPDAPTSAGPSTLGFPAVEPGHMGPGARPDSTDESGLSGLLDFGFRTRATRALAPVAYGLLLALLVVAYVANVYTTAMAAATAGAGIGAVLIATVVGLIALAFTAVVGRILLELACNVSDLAGNRDG